MTDFERILIAATLRWIRANGWTLAWRGWTNPDGTVAVGWDNTTVRVWRQNPTTAQLSIFSTDYPVDSVTQGVDVLVALGILPANLSTAYWEALVRVEDWMPLPIGTREDELRRFSQTVGVDR